ncbi:hypothetical protein QFC21_004437 [Naganishia friedmannii]|uniref:Uncharacterized protein n=1 Tax=Naganishia friedmannii TaxID=89922 RepID=A0ACC2VFG8_9TREE|nr:hypothetical protein QFC21_004437 [Naganishia friedmannii]
MSDLDTFFREAPEESGSHDWLNSAYGSHGTDVPSQSRALLGFVPSAYTTHVQPDLLSYSTFGGQHRPIPAFLTEHEHSFTDRHIPSSIATGPVYVDPSYLVPSSQIQTPADSDRMSHHNLRNLYHQVPQAETGYAIGYNFSIDAPLTLNTSPRKEESQFVPVGYHTGFSPHTWFGAFEIAGPPQIIESRQPVHEMQACSIQQAYIAEGAALDQQVPLADELKTTGEEDVAEYHSSWSAHDSALALNQDTEGNESESAPRQSRPPAQGSGNLGAKGGGRSVGVGSVFGLHARSRMTAMTLCLKQLVLKASGQTWS